MTAQFFEKLDKAEGESMTTNTTTVEKYNTVAVRNENQAGGGMKTHKRSRWDIKPEDDQQKNENVIAENYVLASKDDKEGVLKITSANRHSYTAEKKTKCINFTENKNEVECKQKLTRPQLKEVEEDSDVEIIASTAGFNPLRRVRSQTQFATLEEVNKNPFYKKFTSDNMILNSRVANLKYGTVIDLVKGKGQTSEIQNRKYSQRRCESMSKKPTGRKELWPHKDYGKKHFHTDSFDRKLALTNNKSHGTNLINNKTYEHLQNDVNFVDKSKELKATVNPIWSDDDASKTFLGKSVLCDEGGTRTSKNSLSPLSWNPTKTQHQELAYTINTVENFNRPKDPRTDTIKDRLAQSTSNISQTLSVINSTIASNTENSRFSGISEKRYSQSCTFLRPDSLYTYFKCNSDDVRINSFEPLKSFDHKSNITSENLSDQLNNSTVQDCNKLSNYKEIQNSESKRHNENSGGLESIYQTDKREEYQHIPDSKPQNRYISPLSNLYNDSNLKFHEYSNVINKQLESRKRKHEEVPCENLSGHELKRKNVGKVKPMTKLCHAGNEKALKLTTKPYPTKSFASNNHDESGHGRAENSPKINSNDLSIERLRKTKSPPEFEENDNHSHPFKKRHIDLNFDMTGSSLNGYVHSKSSPTSQEERYISKEKLQEKTPSSKKSKSFDSIINELESSKNTTLHEKRNTVEEDKLLQNNKYSNKSKVKKVKPNSSHIVQSQQCENISVHQREKLDPRVKEFEKVIASKKVATESNTPMFHQTSQKNSVLEKVKSADKKKLSEKNAALNKSKNCQKEYAESAQADKKDKSTGKSKCSGNNSSSNKNVKGKSESNNKTPTPQEKKTSSNKAKSVEKPSSSKKTTSINYKNNLNKDICKKDESFLLENSLKNDSVSKKPILGTIKSTDRKSSQRLNTSDIKKVSERSGSSKKNNTNKLKDCSVVLNRKESLAIGKTGYHVSAKKSTCKHDDYNNPSPEKLLLPDEGKFMKTNMNSKKQLSDETTCTDTILQREKSFEKEINSSDKLLHDDNKKVRKDLVLMMKSLPKCEALKVISEFTSIFSADDSHQNIHFPKDQTVPSKKEEMNHAMSQIQMSDEIIDDLKIEPFKIELFKSENNVNTSNLNSEIYFENPSNDTKTDYNSHAESAEKLKFNKRKKLSELDKIHADLESCHGLDDLMKCSGLRTCRLKNESGGVLKGNATDYKLNKKRKVIEPPEEPLFIQDEITIKMEPIPELDFIKQEPDFNE